jgi:hypothetical protein
MLFERKRERDKSLFLNNYFLFLFSDWIRVHTPRPPPPGGAALGVARSRSHHASHEHRPARCLSRAWPAAVAGQRKDKGVAILDYALGNRPSTGVGGAWAAGCGQRARRSLVPAQSRSHRSP